MEVERLRPGDAVVLRSPAEILATLDGHGTLEGLPFMPEMLAFYGSVHKVAKRAEKICDTICPVGSRRLPGCVYLEDARCEGSAHGGCEAECRLYWKDAWLQRVRDDANAPVPSPPELERLQVAAASHTSQPSDPALFRCQATEARRATTQLHDLDLRQYVREVNCGNVTARELARVALLAIPWELRRVLRHPAGQLPHASSETRDKPERLDLQPGEWVEVRSAVEIARTLDSRNTNRGLYFSAPEMAAFCGKRYRVRKRIRFIIDEPTGRMLKMKNDCIVLEGMVCRGDRSVGRWLCGREILPYWRESWLKRVETGSETARTLEIVQTVPVGS
jgi:hypothetical protein